MTSLSIWPHDPLRKIESAMVGQHLLNLLFHRVTIFRVYEVQISFQGWRLAGWIKAVNVKQLGRPLLEPRSVECPATHMSEALSFTKIKLGSLQGFLCPLPVSDVLDRTEHLVGSSRRISFHFTLTVHGAHFPAGTNKPMFRVGSNSAHAGLFCCPEHKLAIFRVDHFAYGG